MQKNQNTNYLKKSIIIGSAEAEQMLVTSKCTEDLEVFNKQNVEKYISPISADILFACSAVALLIGLGMASFADVKNQWDFLLPLTMITQFILAFLVIKGKIWALVGYTIFILGLYISIYFFYIDNLEVALKTILALSFPLFLVLDLWIRKRRYFH